MRFVFCCLLLACGSLFGFTTIRRATIRRTTIRLTTIRLTTNRPTTIRLPTISRTTVRWAIPMKGTSVIRGLAFWNWRFSDTRPLENQEIWRVLWKLVKIIFFLTFWTNRAENRRFFAKVLPKRSKWLKIKEKVWPKKTPKNLAFEKTPIETGPKDASAVADQLLVWWKVWLWKSYVIRELSFGELSFGEL